MTDTARRRRIIDLFSCAGGAAMGYHRAGFEVVGVDIAPQPHYPFEFIQADAMEIIDRIRAVGDGTFTILGWDRLGYFNAVHASPPCHDRSQLHRNYGVVADGTGHMLDDVLAAFADLGCPYVVENVVDYQKPWAWSFELCGASFGLGASGLDLNRHRRFAVNWPVMAPPCQHRRGHTIGVYGNGTNKWHRTKLGRNLTTAEQREAMGTPWMNRAEFAQAIPPAYTEWIGSRLLEVMATSDDQAMPVAVGNGPDGALE